MPGKAEHIGVTSDGRHLVRLLCAVETNGDGSAPEWLHIMPWGPFVVARDGRAFQVSDASGVAARSELPLLLDWEHNSERYDGSTVAAGWAEELAVEDGSGGRAPGVWARMIWAPEGAADVLAKRYRYLSPVLVLDAETRDVQEIVSVALTNKPALRMEQIGKFRERLSAQFGPLTSGREETSTMDKEKRKALCAAFSLAVDASDDEILAAAHKHAGTKELFANANASLQSANAQVETFRGRVTELESQLAAAQLEAAKVGRGAKIEAMFAANVNKIPPAQVPGLRAMFEKTPASFDAFVEFQLPTMVAIGEPASESRTRETSAGGSASTGGAFVSELSDKQRAALRERGMTDEEITAAEKRTFEARARLRAGDEED